MLYSKDDIDRYLISFHYCKDNRDFGDNFNTAEATVKHITTYIIYIQEMHSLLVCAEMQNKTKQTNPQTCKFAFTILI